MKKHSFLSYILWATTAVLVGITISSATVVAAKTAHRYIAGAGTTFTYIAERLPESVIEKRRPLSLSCRPKVTWQPIFKPAKLFLRKTRPNSFQWPPSPS